MNNDAAIGLNSSVCAVRFHTVEVRWKFISANIQRVKIIWLLIIYGSIFQPRQIHYAAVCESIELI